MTYFWATVNDDVVVQEAGEEQEQVGGMKVSNKSDLHLIHEGIIFQFARFPFGAVFVLA